MIQVAIVEGNKTVRESLETIINLASGCRCVGAWDSVKAGLEFLRRQQPDVLLLDVLSPNALGLASTLRIRELLPTAQVIMLTVYEDPDHIFSGLRAGACGYLLKRSTPEQIISAIREAHQAGCPDHTRKQPPNKNSSLGELGSSPRTAKLA